MNVLGSVFLGDASRYRAITASPTSPPMSPIPNTASTSSASKEPPPIDPELSLELRVRWLEVLLLGSKQRAPIAKSKEPGGPRSDEKSLALKTEELQKKLNGIIEGNDGLRKFMDRFDQHAQLLNPSFALSGAAAPPSYSAMSPEEFDAFLAEMEPDIRSADRDLREIDILEKRGILGAGKLADYETLRPRIDALATAHEEDVSKVTELERRIADVLRQYTTRVDTLSELFVEWSDVLSGAEDKVARLEKERSDKIRLGYEGE